MQIELAEQDRARLLEPPRDLGVGVRHALLEEPAGAGRAHAGGVDVVLERDRDAVQRAAPLAAPGFRLHRPGVGERLVAR